MFTEKLVRMMSGLFQPKQRYITVHGPARRGAACRRCRRRRFAQPTWPSSWTATAAGPRPARTAPQRRATPPARRPCASIIRASDDWGVKHLTIYAFSTENWSRSKEEVGALMGLLLKYFASEIDELDEKHVRIRILGDVGGSARGPARRGERAPWSARRPTTSLQLNIALNYGGRAELLSARRGRLPEQVRSGALESRRRSTRPKFESRSCTPPVSRPVDLLIRTSGEHAACPISCRGRRFTPRWCSTRPAGRTTTARPI